MAYFKTSILLRWRIEKNFRRSRNQSQENRIERKVHWNFETRNKKGNSDSNNQAGNWGTR